MHWPMADLSVAILSYNTRDLLRRCLDTLFEAAGDLELDVIVVDNGSTDGSLEMLASYRPTVTLIANQANVGFAAANNAALDRAIADILATTPEVILTYLPVRDPTEACVPKKRWYGRGNSVRSYQIGALDVLGADGCATLLLADYAESADSGSAWLVLRRREGQPNLPRECDIRN